MFLEISKDKKMFTRIKKFCLSSTLYLDSVRWNFSEHKIVEIFRILHYY